MGHPPSPSALIQAALDNAKAARALSEKYPQQAGATQPLAPQPAPVPVSGPPSGAGASQS